MASESASKPNASAPPSGEEPPPAANSAGSSSQESMYECNICLETAKDAVVSMCGHLFCWPCLLQWLETRPNHSVCPVCKAAISKSKVIPLYGRGGSQEDPRKKHPPRPSGQRTEPTGQSFGGYTFGDGGSFHMSFGIGAFPFGLFTSNFHFGEPRPAQAAHPGENGEDQVLSKVFLGVAILFIFWLLIA